MSLSCPKVSIIVAIFNAGATLSRCLDSVLGQSFQDYEVIAVDDGSTDDSWKILCNYRDADPRFRIFRQDNRGVSATRQFGLGKAQGEFTMHLDADDWIEQDMLSSMCEKADSDGADWVICGLKIHTCTGDYSDMQRPVSMNPEEVFGQMLCGTLHGSLCNKLIRRRLYGDFGVSFPKGVDCGEDLYVCLSILSKGIIPGHVPFALYHYDKTQNNDSVTNKWFDYPVQKRVALIEAIEPMITPATRHSFNNYVGRIAYDALFCTRAYCPNYRSLFAPYSTYIMECDMPAHKRLLIRLGLHGFRLPLRQIRHFFFRNMA